MGLVAIRLLQRQRRAGRLQHRPDPPHHEGARYPLHHPPATPAAGLRGSERREVGSHARPGSRLPRPVRALRQQRHHPLHPERRSAQGQADRHQDVSRLRQGRPQGDSQPQQHELSPDDRLRVGRERHPGNRPQRGDTAGECPRRRPDRLEHLVAEMADEPLPYRQPATDAGQHAPW